MLKNCINIQSLLTWDANTVTHVLGIRAFGTQLLCEQVIGRALRRQSYELNEEGLFNVEYADVFGIPFSSGQLDFYDRASFDEAGAYDDSNNAIAIDLFTSFESAQHWVDTAQDDNSPIVKPVYLTPQTLLACIAAVDIVSVDIADFAVTRSGARILGVVGTVTPAALIDVLTR